MASNIGSEEWVKLSPLLDRALELDPAGRESWLVELETTKPELAAALRELLAEKGALDARGFLEHSPVDLSGQATLAGQRIGAYEIEHLIGQGGMGTVWLAHRCDGRYEGNAAVKLLNAALVGRPAEQRFVREGSVLAGLQHPNIAHLIDAGVITGGQPYLILEHVDGSSIDAYCEASRLDVRARLRLFLDVLEAVAHAHLHLVVHRDLKPSNILVTDDGIVKLLDFGVAALLQSGSGEQKQRDFTRELGAAMTPEFAAPEQLLGQPVTTATDVYALGLVLFILLGGPEAAFPQGRSAAELVRDTLERELPLLSQVTSDVHKRRLLRGDLDNIVMKALKKEPRERYATVAAFADDLRHHLADEPVSARPDSFGYRAGKFVRRHRGGVLTGALTAMALVGTTGFALVQMLEAQRQRDEAQEQTRRAQAFNGVITSLLSQVGPDGRALGPEELLDRAVEQANATYADDPAFLVGLLIQISGRYYDLRNTRKELATLVEAESAARRTGDPSLIVDVQCNTVETELASGRTPEAQRRMDEAHRLLPHIEDPPVMLQVSCLRAQAQLAMANNDMGQAVAFLEEARDVLETTARTTGNVYPAILSLLGSYHSLAGDLLVAHEYTLEVVELHRRFGRQDSMPGIITRLYLAFSFYNQGQVQRAALMFREAVPDRSESRLGNPPSTEAKARYGEILARLGRPDAGVPLIREAISEADRGGHRTHGIQARLLLADALELAGRPEEAQAALVEATELIRRDEPAIRFWLAEADRVSAEILLAQQRLDEAEEKVSTALRHLDDSWGRDGSNVARTRLTQARVRLARSEFPQAAESARAALALFEKNTLEPEQSADVGEALLVLAQAELAAGDETAARRSVERAGVSLRNGLGAGHELTLLSERLSAQLH